MTINDIPEALFSRLRFQVLLILFGGAKDFAGLKRSTGASDGNLSAQLSKLEEAALVSCTKAFVGKKPRSTYALTAAGRRTLRLYAQYLQSIIGIGEGGDGHAPD